MPDVEFGSKAGGRRFFAAVFFVFAFAVLFLSGCVANDDSSMPWAAPDPSDGSIALPGSLGGR